MSEFFTFDRTKLDALLAEDVMNHMGSCTHPEQAVHCVFLAYETGAITWDKAQWPDLALGWRRTPQWPDRGLGVNDAPPPADEGDTELRDEDQMEMWLHMRPTWPVLSTESFFWYPAVQSLDNASVSQRVAATVELAVAQLNKLHAMIEPMVREYANQS